MTTKTEEKKDVEVKTPAKLKAELMKEFGEDIMGVDEVKEVIPSTATSLNVILGKGGLPVGRVVEIYGPEHGGKTIISLDFIRNAQAMGKLCCYIDVEQALSWDWAEACGVDMKKLLLIKPTDGYQVFEIIRKLLESKACGLIVVDSVAALVTKEELEGKLEDTSHRMGGYIAKLMSTGLKSLLPLLASGDTALLFVNQVRDSLDMYKPEATPGGRALKFYSSIRLRVNKRNSKDKQILNEADPSVIEGHLTVVTVEKNKCGARTKRAAEFPLMYAYGVDAIGDIMILLAEDKVPSCVYVRGGGFKFNGKSYTEKEFRALLESDKKVRAELTKALLDTLTYDPYNSNGNGLKEKK